jgi:prepilin-type N-terminal cleavage/methylation domain-containing protein
MIRRSFRTKGRAGYSLFEILVALVVIGLTAAVVGPGMTASLNSAARHSARLYLEQSILSVRRAAIAADLDYFLSDALAGASDLHGSPVSLPQEWEAEVVPEIRFSADGSCTSGLVRIRAKDQTEFEQYRIEPPSCRPVG